MWLLPLSEFPLTDICSPLMHLVPVVTEMTSMSSMTSPSLLSTIPAKTFRRECELAWPTIISVNLSITNFPILSAVCCGKEKSDTEIVVPLKVKLLIKRMHFENFQSNFGFFFATFGFLLLKIGQFSNCILDIQRQFLVVMHFLVLMLLFAHRIWLWCYRGYYKSYSGRSQAKIRYFMRPSPVFFPTLRVTFYLRSL